VIVTENPEAAKRLLARVRSERKPRTPGLHASDVPRCLRASKHRHDHPELYEEGGPHAEDDHSTVVFLLGESAHIFLGGKTDSDKTLFFEGLSCTPDEASNESNEFWPPIREYKTTRKSSSKNLDQLPKFTAQAAVYCLAHGVLEASIFVIYTQGNYKRGDAGTFVDWRWFDVDISQRELDWWRREIVRRKRVVEQARTWKDIPVSENWAPGVESSCSYCSLKKAGECEGGGEWQHPFPNVEFKQAS